MNITKISLEVLPSKVPSLGVFVGLTSDKKIITKVLLVLPLYLILFFIWWRFRHVSKAIASVENILNNDDFFGDIVDTPKDGIGQHKKRE